MPRNLPIPHHRHRRRKDYTLAEIVAESRAEKTARDQEAEERSREFLAELGISDRDGSAGSGSGIG